jgi:cation diffusion facilitator CzcD-associated flavoprotein CzcO
VEVAVIGAGPYGLALASHLRTAGVGVQVIGRPMSSWRERMPRGMLLKSEGFASTIAAPYSGYELARFCAEVGQPYADMATPVPVETFAEYGLWFQQALVPDVLETEVNHVGRRGAAFELSLSDGCDLVAQRLVVACGFSSFRHVPSELLDLPPECVSHSSEHITFDRLADRDVAVVGAGQSALETAALLREAGARPTVVARGSTLSWNLPPEAGPRSLRRRLRAPLTGLGAGWSSWIYADLPRAVARFPAGTRVRLAREVLGPAGAWWLRERVEPHVPVVTGHSLSAAHVDGGRVRLLLSNGGAERELAVDHVIAATGYRVRIDRISFLDAALRDGLRTTAGAPALTSWFESSVPGLYFIGMAAANTFGPVMRFVCGTGFAARRTSRRLAATVRPRARGYLIQRIESARP